MSTDVDILPTSILPKKYRSIFSFNHFNKMQSESFDTIYNSDNNCLINSPTGSGKTVLFELAILRLFGLGPANMNNKVLYLAPSKALCAEKYNDWTSKFSFLSITIGVLTSETSLEEVESVKRSNIIILTPEKLDLLTRRLSNYDKLLNDVKLTLIDEIHILKDTRGSTLEVVATRINRMCNVRIVGASATVPNLCDISIWLKNKGNLNPAVILHFDDTYRSVQLDKIVLSYASQRSKYFRFDRFLDLKLLDVIKHHGNNKPTLIFCPTRNSCVRTAKYLSDNFDSNLSSRHPPIQFDEKELLIYTANGIAFHHAGLSSEDRSKIELLFIDGKLSILCSTSTLSLGVNLPTYLVIIKGTKRWYCGSFHEYKETDVLQMIGRAGRPQFETKGKLVIMTTVDQKYKYERLVKDMFEDDSEKMESCLHLNLAEHLVAEISLGTIKNIDDTLQWLKSTFFFIRFTANPSYYKEVSSCHSLEPNKGLYYFCQKYLNSLINEKIVSPSSAGDFRCTEYGDVMTKYYVLYPTMRNIIRSKVGNTLLDVLTIFSRSSEFSEFRIKYNEQKLYKVINLSRYIKFPLCSTEFRDSDKVMLLLQYELCGLDFPNYSGSMKLYYSFEGDKRYVFRQASRIIHCMIDVFIYRKDYVSLFNTLKLSRCITGRCWENSPTELKQLDGIDLECVRKLQKNDVKGFEEAKYLSQMQLESFLDIEPGTGKNTFQSLQSLPEFKINATLASNKVRTNLEMLEINLIVSISIDNMECDAWKTKNSFINTIVGISTGELLDFRRFATSELIGNIKTFRLTASVADRQQKIYCHIFPENMANIGAKYVLSLDIIERWKFDNLMNQISRDESELNSSTTKESEIVLSQYVKSDSESDLNSDDLIFDPVKSIRSVTKVSSLISRKKRNLKESRDQLEVVRKVRLDGNFECNHLCKNKTKCRHFCCRDGIPKLRNHRNIKNYVGTETNIYASKFTTACPSVDSSNITQGPLATHQNSYIIQSQDYIPLSNCKRKKIKLGQKVGVFNLNCGGLFDY